MATMSRPGASASRGVDRFGAFLPGAAVLAIAAFFLFAGLGDDELRSADEATHAQVSREMVRDGHWLYPTCRGEPYMEKPPLKFWLTALTFKIAGESEFTVRLGSALFGLASVWGVMRLGRLFFNRKVGIGAGFVLATFWEFYHNHCARTGELDSAILFFTVMLVGAVWQARVESRPRHVYLAALWMALGFLTKGHVILIPLAWLPLAWWIRPSRDGLPRATGTILLRHWLWALLLFFALTAPWFILQEIHYGGTWFRYMLQHNVVGYVRGTVENADAGFRYYLEEVVWLDYPWPPIALLGLLLVFSRRAVDDLPFARAARFWLSGWIVATALVLATSRTALPWYHLPLLAPMALLAGLVLARWWDSERVARPWAWDGLWLALHLALFFAMAGFLECAQDWLQTWLNHDTDAFDGLCDYFIEDAHQRSMVVALMVLPVFPATLALRWVLTRHGVAHPWLLASRARVMLLAGLAAIAMLQEPVDDAEGARDEAHEILTRAALPGRGILPIHVFESSRPHSPHWDLSPSTYYYLASMPRVELCHRAADLRAWEQFVADAKRPCVAIVPTAWIRQPFPEGRTVVPLMEINPSSLVRVFPRL